MPSAKLLAMKRILDAAVRRKRERGANKRVEHKTNEQIMGVAQTFHHEIIEGMEANEKQELLGILLGLRRKETSDVAAVHRAVKILEEYPKLLLKFYHLFIPNKLKGRYLHLRKLKRIRALLSKKFPKRVGSLHLNKLLQSKTDENLPVLCYQVRELAVEEGIKASEEPKDCCSSSRKPSNRPAVHMTSEDTVDGPGPLSRNPSNRPGSHLTSEDTVDGPGPLSRTPSNRPAAHMTSEDTVDGPGSLSRTPSNRPAAHMTSEDTVDGPDPLS